MTARETALAMKSVFEGPDNSIPEPQTSRLELRVEQDVEGNNLMIADVITHLPADAAAGVQDPRTFIDDFVLSMKIPVNRESPRLVWLPNVVRR